MRKQKKALRATTIDHDLNYAVVLPMFLGEVRVGADATILDVVFDTGSDWLVIPDLQCEECTGTKVDNSVAEVADASVSERNYGSASLIGSTFRDKVCLSSSTTSCISDFEYFAFKNQTGINAPVEGILGMCQNKQMMLSTSEIDIGPLFARELKLDGKIPTETFSFAMFGFNDDESSIVDFG